MRKLLSILLAMYLAAGVLPVQVMAEEAEQPAEEQTEVIEETEEVTEETEEVIEEEQEEVPEEETVPETEEPEEPVIEETEIPEAAEEPVQTEEPVIEEVIPEEEIPEEVTEVPAEEPVIEEAVPETEEPAIEPEAPAAEEVVPVPEIPVIEETEPEPVPETVIPEEPVQTEAPAEEKKEEPAEVIEEISGEEAEVYEASYKVTFYANGGYFKDSKTKVTETVTAGDDITVKYIEIPIKDGYMFYGWYTSKDFKADTRLGGWLTPTGDTSVYACYKPYYTVTLNMNGKGSVSIYNINDEYDSGSVAKFKVVKGLNVFSIDMNYWVDEPESYSFAGFYLDKNCSPGKEVNDDYVPSSDITLYAKWVPVDYTEITFHGNGGTYEGSETYKEEYDAYQPMSNVPEFTYSGKVLEGWYLDAGLTEKIKDINAFTPASAGKSVEPLDLYAKWTTPVKVTLNANGGKLSGSATKTYSVRKGQGLRDRVPDPVRSGYFFAGWYKDTKYTEKVDIQLYPFTSAVTLYAKWVPYVKVTFKGNNKLLFYDHQEEDDDYSLNETVYLVAKGYSFVESRREFGLVQVISGNWRHNADLMPEFMETSGVFTGWFKDSALTKPFSYTDKITANTALYPKTVKKSTPQYTVMFDLNGGMIRYHMANREKFYKGEFLEYGTYFVSPPRGKRLLGFTTVKNDVSTLIKPVNPEDTVTTETVYTNYKVTKDQTVYAYYVPEYKVVLEAGYGYFRNIHILTMTSREEIRYVAKGDKITDIYPKSADTEGTICSDTDGKIFLGWYSDPAFKNLVTHKLHQYAVTKDIILYAKWGNPIKAGWKKTNGKWWYQCEDGSYYNEGLQKIGKKYYFFQSNGYIKTGWVQVGKSWYYFNTGGDAAVSWKKIGKVWYYFSSEGVMQKSWQKIGGKWYYFKTSGAMVTGWQKIGKKWYWFESGGAMVTGWKKISGKWYWFDGSGVMITGWKKIGGKWYWFESGGAMFANGSKTIGGKTYKFDSNGVCLNP